MKSRILKALLSEFKTPNEIQEVIYEISDYEIRNLIMKELKNSINQNAILKSNNPEIKKRRINNNSNSYLIENVYKIFRKDLHMTNNEVENWLRNQYGLQRNIGKNGLKVYLKRIMKSEGNDFLRKLLADLSLLMRKKGKTDKELEIWWKEYEKWEQ